MSLQPLPAVNADNEGFWTSGADGVLRIARCTDCRTWFHPPTPVCPACLSTRVGMEPTSGRGTVRSCTVNVQPWSPDMQVPFVVGIVSIDDAPGVQLTTRFVDVAPDAVRHGMAVEVVFENVDDVYLPLFRPADGGRS
jgi:uncharacterized protein